MYCHNCLRDNVEKGSFCIYCGSELRDETVNIENPTLDAVSDAVNELRRDVRWLQRQVREIRSLIEGQGAHLITPQPAQVGREVVSTVPEPVSSRPVFWERLDWEQIVGGNWLARIGVLAVVIGTGFFLKLAFDNGWIGEGGRVILGVVGGLAFLGASEYLQKRYLAYAQALAGGGIAILYLSIFAAFALYGLIDFYPAIALLLLVSCTSAALALRHDSVALAIIGIVGAFVAPLTPFTPFRAAELVVTETLSGLGLQLIAYIIIVDIGVVVLSTFRNWRWFTLLALLGSLLFYAGWYDEYSETVGLLTSEGSLTIIFLIFVVATTLFHLIWRRPLQASAFTLMVINASAYFVISYAALLEDFREWMGGFTLFLSLFYGGIAYLALIRIKGHAHLTLMSLGIALIFLVIAVPVQLDGSWIAVAWSVQGAVLTWISFNLRMWQLRVMSVGIFALLIVRLLLFDTPIDLGDFQIILNYRMLAFTAGISALYLAAYLVRRWGNSAQELDVGVPSVGLLSNLSRPRVMFPALLLLANLLTLWILSAEVIAAVDSNVVDANRETEYFLKSLSLSVLWAVYASLVLTIGIVKRWQLVRLGGLTLLAIPVAKLFLVDTFNLEQGYRVAAYFSLGLILLVGGFLYQRYGTVIRGFLFEEQQISAKS